jgi:hypothetical protein
MTKRTVGISFCALAVVLFLSRYIIAALYRGFDNHQWGSQDFADYLGYVGIEPWFFAALFLAAGIYYLVRSESEK